MPSVLPHVLGSRFCILLTAWLSLMAGAGARAEDGAPSPEAFEKTSIALRTALHYDPAVDVPLQKLVALYREAGRSEELLSLYAAHVAQYPQDGNAKLVLARIYSELKDRRAMEFLKTAVAQHPEHALLAWEYGRVLLQRHDAEAVPQMARAVSLEKGAARRALWYGELLKAASVQGREDLVLTQTQKLIDEGSMNPEQRLRWARQALSLRLGKTAERLMQGLPEQTLGTDSLLEATVLRAELLASTGDKAGAVAMLDKLLEKLAPEHWRRAALLMLRMDLDGDQGREALVAAARARWSRTEGRSPADALSLADVLANAHRAHEALTVLREASKLFPESATVEARLLDVWEAQGVDAEALAWMEERTKAAQGSRPDLALRRVRWLFSANEPEKARAAFSGMLEQMEARQQVERSVEMARWLRRRNQPGEAATLLEAALRKAPQRWDLRRELGEIYFSQKRRTEASQLFAGEWSRDLPPDALLEVAQFLMVKQLWLEARAILEPWVAANEGAFDGRLLLVRIHAKLADDAQVEAGLEGARALCDTPARYQAWLECLLEYAEARDMTGPWLQRESDRLAAEAREGGPGRDVALVRWMTLLEQAVARREDKFAEGLLASLSALPGLPADRKLHLERMRLELLSNDSSRVTEAESGLRAMMQQDAAHREDHRLRLALLYQRASRPDLAVEVLTGADLGKATAVAELRSVLPLLQENRMLAQALAGAERLTQLEPAERSHWTQWLTLLAMTGGEEKLRFALREVLAKAPDWNLAEDVQQGLRDHLVASQWRSVQAALLTEGGWAEARRAAAAFDQVELTEDQRRWLRWLRAWMSARLGDRASVEDALAELAKPSTGSGWIAFPDGMEVSVEAARAMLQKAVAPTPPPPAMAATPSVSTGPLPPFQTAWGFKLGQGTFLVRTVASPENGLALFCDSRGSLFAVELQSGKLRWQRRSELAGVDPFEGMGLPMVRRGRMPRGYGHPQGQQEFRQAPDVFATKDRIFVLTESTVECLDASHGSLLWRSAPEAAPSGSEPAAPQSRMTLAGECLYLWQPASGKISALSPATGKLQWESTVPIPPAAPPNPNSPYYGSHDPMARLRSGVRVQGERLLVWGQTVALLDAANGTVLWRLAVEPAGGFPIALLTPDEAGAATTSTIQATAPMLVSRFQTQTSGASMQPPAVRMTTTQQWAFTSVLQAALEPTDSPPALELHGDEVVAVQSGGESMITEMGIPTSTWISEGRVVGSTGRRMVTADSGGTVWVSDMGGSPDSFALEDQTGPVVLFPEDEEDDASLASPPVAIEGMDPFAPGAQFVSATSGRLCSATMAGARLYATTASVVRAADIRGGAILFTVPWPAEVAAWLKETQPAQPNPMQGRPPYAPVPQAFGQRLMFSRSVVPAGEFVQDQQGSGMLCGPTAAVVGELWIVPLDDRRIICLRGQPSVRKDPPSTAAAPAR